MRDSHSLVSRSNLRRAFYSREGPNAFPEKLIAIKRDDSTNSLVITLKTL